MNTIFYIAAAVALISTGLAIAGRNAIHSLLFLIVSLLSISVIFYILGAPFIAALEIIIYAGAIMMVLAGYLHSVWVGGVSLFFVFVMAQRFFGDGSVAQGVFHESLNMAAIWKLPVIYVVENNQMSMGTQLHRHSCLLDLTVRGGTYSVSGLAPSGWLQGLFPAVGVRRFVLLPRFSPQSLCANRVSASERVTPCCLWLD